MSSTTGATVSRGPFRAARPRPKLLGVIAWELRKLRAQHRARWVALIAALAPIPIVAVIHGQARPPKDTLFGRYAPDNGFSLALLVLGFASQWLLPLMTAIVAGDIFASEDQHGTWKTVLTRSTSRSQLFWAKTLTAAGFSVVVLALLATATVVSSVLIVGHQPLLGLTGQTIPDGTAARLVIASWASMLAPVLGFTCLAILLSVISRNPAAGVAAPVVLAMVMQLIGTLGGIEALRPFLLSTPFENWHGLLTEPRFAQPLLEGFLVSAGWCVACLAASYTALRRRDITGG